MVNFEDYFKKLDMYGQSINFSYMGKSTFATTCGGCASILLTILLLYYTVVLLIELVLKTEPYYLTKNNYVTFPPKLNLQSDTYAIFPDTKVPQSNNFNATQAQMQMAIGLMDQRTMTFRPIDPRYFNLHMFHKLQTVTYVKDPITNKIVKSTVLDNPYVFFDLCTRFRDFDSEFVKWNLKKTYCIYSNISIFNSTNDEAFSVLNIDINKCSNNSLYYVSKEETRGYRRTYGNLTIDNFAEPQFDIL